MSHVAFLRGINVGGHRVTNPELAAIFTDLGFAAAVPYQAAGNVMLASDGEPDIASIEAALADRLGYAVPTVVRSVPDVTAIATAQPFAHELIETGAGKVQVMLLAGSCRAADVEPFSTDHDRLVAAGSEIYLLPAEGIGRTQLDLAGLDRAVGTFTIRTQSTLIRLAAKLS